MLGKSRLNTVGFFYAQFRQVESIVKNDAKMISVCSPKLLSGESRRES